MPTHFTHFRLWPIQFLIRGQNDSSIPESIRENIATSATSCFGRYICSLLIISELLREDPVGCGCGLIGRGSVRQRNFKQPYLLILPADLLYRFHRGQNSPDSSAEATLRVQRPDHRE